MGVSPNPRGACPRNRRDLPGPRVLFRARTIEKLLPTTLGQELRSSEWDFPPSPEFILTIPAGRAWQRGKRRGAEKGKRGCVTSGIEMLFPTRFKATISSRLSYPVGAELITAELAGVPQAPIEIQFYSKYERVKTRGEPYPVFEVSYSGTESPFEAGWHITVRPVPRALKHTISVD